MVSLHQKATTSAYGVTAATQGDPGMMMHETGGAGRQLTCLRQITIRSTVSKPVPEREGWLQSKPETLYATLPCLMSSAGKMAQGVLSLDPAWQGDVLSSGVMHLCTHLNAP